MIQAPAPQPGRKQAIAFTLIVHLGLVAALFFGVQWKQDTTDMMEVELWSARPVTEKRAALPPPEAKPEPKPEPRPEPKPAPEPPPKKPDIAVKEERKPPPKKPDPPKPEVKPAPPQPKPATDPFREALERETRQRQQAAAQASLRAGAEAEARAAAGRRGLESYASKIRTKIRGNIFLPPGIQGNPEAVFEVNQLPTGEVLSLRLLRTSGNPVLDEAIERAIRRSSPLPKPDDPALFQRTLEIRYRPNEE